MKLDDFIEKKAAADGSYAIAYALLKLAEAQTATALALDMLGTNRAGRADHAQGCMEFIGGKIEAIADAIADR